MFMFQYSGSWIWSVHVEDEGLQSIGYVFCEHLYLVFCVFSVVDLGFLKGGVHLCRGCEVGI